MGFSGFRIPELQDFPGFPVFRDPEPHPVWNIGILLHNQANQRKHFCPECMLYRFNEYWMHINNEEI
jgi:hypothetical protein